MSERTDGLHHVTAISGEAQETADFYTGVLGLRLAKTTVNFDDPATYHLYFGDETGPPGTILTFFPFRGSSRGRVGKGQAGATAFSIPDGSIPDWVDRLAEHGVEADELVERFGATVLALRDGDGHPIELVTGVSPREPCAGGPAPAERAIRGFHGVTLLSGRPAATGEVLGYDHAGEAGDRARYRTAGDHAAVVNVRDPGDTKAGRQGAGTVHHVAFRTPDDEARTGWRERLSAAGPSVTPPKDRQSLRSVYVREPGGVLVEVATDGPGFTDDEDVDELGTELKLPPWLEEERELLADRLPPIEPRAAAGAD